MHWRLGPHQFVGSLFSSAPDRTPRWTIEFVQVQVGSTGDLLRQRDEILQRSDRIHQMIEDAEKEHDVELPDPIRGQLGDVDVELFDLEVQGGLRQVEGGPAVDFRGPAVMIRCQDACRLPPLGLEAEVAVPGADVQDRLASQVQRSEDRVPLGAEQIQ
jgi:hypothetical protein